MDEIFFSFFFSFCLGKFVTTLFDWDFNGSIEPFGQENEMIFLPLVEISFAALFNAVFFFSLSIYSVRLH